MKLCKTYKLYQAFTLIELLIVIVIIGILSVALIPRLVGMQWKARDKARMADLRQVQTALEFYANEHGGNYPSTYSGGTVRRFWNCSYRWSQTTSWLSWYVPWLAPDYISVLPVDPKPSGTLNCYLYKSNTIDYILLAFRTVEGQVPVEFQRTNLVDPNENTFAIYSSWAIHR